MFRKWQEISWKRTQRFDETWKWVNFFCKAGLANILSWNHRIFSRNVRRANPSLENSGLMPRSDRFWQEGRSKVLCLFFWMNRRITLRINRIMFPIWRLWSGLRHRHLQPGLDTSSSLMMVFMILPGQIQILVFKNILEEFFFITVHFTFLSRNFLT